MSRGSQSDLVVLWLNISAELTYAGPSQISHVLSIGVKAAYIGDEQNDECVEKGVEAGLYQVVFSESLLRRIRWRPLMNPTVSNTGKNKTL